MIQLPERPKRSAETDVLRACLIALNRMPRVRAVRNNNGKSPCACKACAPKLCLSCRSRIMRPITFGLGDGSPDIQCRVELLPSPHVIPAVFWVEVKKPGGRTSKERADLQRMFRDEAATRGELTAEVTSADGAVAAAERMIAEYRHRLEVFRGAS